MNFPHFEPVFIATARFLLLGVVLVTAHFATASESEPLAARVIVLANRDDAESLQLARHYMEKRQVPAANLLALPMPKDEGISWRQFIDAIYQPAQDELVKRGWIEAIGMDQADKLGRKKYAISGHRIAYLVVCRGVPLRVEHSAELYEPVPPLTKNAQFRTNVGSVDGELALLAASGYPINAFVPNPLFNKARPTFLDEAKVVKVSRLDGATLADASALVDNAITAERQGLVGRAYVDIGGPHPDGDKWLESAARQIDELGFDADVERSPAVFGGAARFDAPVLYFGWYAGALNGPFARPGFHFPPGAIALHIHSYSAQTLRSAEADWCGPLVARGVTATFGNVHEPYLQFTHVPPLLLRALAAGRTLGDAAYFALPALSWQAVVIGDPLYRPFTVSFVEQWQRRHEMTAEQFAYVVLREVKRLVREGQERQAWQTASEALRARPGLVLALRTAELGKTQGDVAAALKALDLVPVSAPADLALVPVVAQCAQFYAEHGAPQKALALFSALLGIENLPSEQRLALLSPAMKAAEAAGATESFALWKLIYETLTQKAMPPKN